MMEAKREGLVGNRLALMGALVYLLEWVVIIPVAAPGPFPPATSPDVLADSYAQGAGGQALFAGWFSLVLLGRIALAAGIRGPLRRSRGEVPLVADAAVGVMIVSVVLEIAAYAVAAAAGSLASNGGDAGAVAAANSAAYWLNGMIFTPVGVFVLLSSLAMLWSKLFPTWVCWLGIVSGIIGTVGGVLSGPAVGAEGSPADAMTGIGVLGFWIWMLVTGIILFRRAGRPTTD